MNLVNISNNFKRVLGMSALGLIALLGTSTIANAQYTKYDRKQDKKIVKQQQKIAKQQQKIDRMQAKRYRVYRNGSYDNTDERGAQLLEQAVNRGYQQGFNAGKNDRQYSRGSNWYNNSPMYRSGNYGYQSYVDSSQYQYYFRQGFQRGYQDGYNSRYQYGTNSNNGLNILGSIMQSILNFQQY